LDLQTFIFLNKLGDTEYSLEWSSIWIFKRRGIFLRDFTFCLILQFLNVIVWNLKRYFDCFYLYLSQLDHHQSNKNICWHFFILELKKSTVVVHYISFLFNNIELFLDKLVWYVAICQITLWYWKFLIHLC